MGGRRSYQIQKYEIFVSLLLSVFEMVSLLVNEYQGSLTPYQHVIVSQIIQTLGLLLHICSSFLIIS